MQPKSCIKTHMLHVWKQPNRQAFSILELIVVLLIMAVFSAIATATWQTVQANSKDRALENELMAIGRNVNALSALEGPGLTLGMLQDALNDGTSGTSSMDWTLHAGDPDGFEGLDPETLYAGNSWTGNLIGIVQPEHRDANYAAFLIIGNSGVHAQVVNLTEHEDGNGDPLTATIAGGECYYGITPGCEQMSAFSAPVVGGSTVQLVRMRTNNFSNWENTPGTWGWGACETVTPTQENPYEQTECAEQTRTVGAYTDGSWEGEDCIIANIDGTTLNRCRSQTRDITDWGAWSSYAFVNCTFAVATGEDNSETQCQERNRGRTAWTVGSAAYSNCSASSSGSTQRQCSQRSRERNSMSTWGGWDSWQFWNCGWSDSPTSTYRQQCRRRDSSNGGSSWSTQSWAFSSCSPNGSASTTIQRMCQARRGSWKSWTSWTSFAYTNCTSSYTSTLLRECQPRTRTWAAWDESDAAFANCTQVNTDTAQTQCREQSREAGDWEAPSAWITENCEAAFTSDGTLTTQCQSQNRSIGAWSSSDTVETCESTQLDATSTGTETRCRSDQAERSPTEWTDWTEWQPLIGDNCTVGETDETVVMNPSENYEGYRQQRECG